jgi:hypothetical protein
MMLGDMQAIEAGLVGGAGEFDAFVVKLRYRPLAGFDMVEKSNFHDASILPDACSAIFRGVHPSSAAAG